MRNYLLPVMIIFCSTALARFTSIDPNREFHNPYSYVGNNPVNSVDLDGRNSFLAIWFSKDGESGHAGVAVENYVEKEVTVDGVTTTQQVKDGTLTYYDLWPEKPVADRDLQNGVKPDYNSRILSGIKDLLANDPSKSGKSGNVSEFGEERQPDGVIELSQVFQQDQSVKGMLVNLINKAQLYNACDNNCSTFAQAGIQGAHPGLNAGQDIKATLALRLLGFKDANVVAPNNLYNAVSQLPGAKVIQGPQSITAKPYLEYHGK